MASPTPPGTLKSQKVVQSSSHEPPYIVHRSVTTSTYEVKPEKEESAVGGLFSATVAVAGLVGAAAGAALTYGLMSGNSEKTKEKEAPHAASPQSQYYDQQQYAPRSMYQDDASSYTSSQYYNQMQIQQGAPSQYSPSHVSRPPRAIENYRDDRSAYTSRTSGTSRSRSEVSTNRKPLLLTDGAHNSQIDAASFVGRSQAAGRSQAGRSRVSTRPPIAGSVSGKSDWRTVAASDYDSVTSYELADTSSEAPSRPPMSGRSSTVSDWHTITDGDYERGRVPSKAPSKAPSKVGSRAPKRSGSVSGRSDFYTVTAGSDYDSRSAVPRTMPDAATHVSSRSRATTARPRGQSVSGRTNVSAADDWKTVAQGSVPDGPRNLYQATYQTVIDDDNSERFASTRSIVSTASARTGFTGVTGHQSRAPTRAPSTSGRSRVPRSEAARSHAAPSAARVPLPAPGAGSTYTAWDAKTVGPNDSISCIGER